MECMKLTGLQSQSLCSKVHLLLLLLFFFFLLLLSCLLTSFLLTLRSFRISSLLAWSNSEPFWQLLSWSLLEFGQFVLPSCFQCLSTEYLGTTFIKLLPVSIAPGVCPPLILREHTDGGRMFACEGFRVKSLFDGFVPHLQFLSLCQFFELIILVFLSLFVVIFVCLQGYNGVPDLLSLGSQLI